MRSFFEKLSGAPPKDDPSAIAQTPGATTSGMDLATSDPIIRSGPAESSGVGEAAACPPATIAEKFSRTSAMSRLEEALTKKALTWCEMLADPNTEAKTQIDMFKLASEHLARMRRSGGDDDDEDDTKTKLPGIDALRELMEGTAEKKIHAMLPDIIEDQGILVLPTFKRGAGRPTTTEMKNRQRLVEAGLHFKPPSHSSNKSRSKAGGGDDSDLAKLLNGGGRGK